MPGSDAPRIVRVVDPDATVRHVRAAGRRIVTFSGYSAGGYQDDDWLAERLSAWLKTFDAATLVCAGATVDGIGEVYRLAGEFGLSSIGVVSSLALTEGAVLAQEAGTIYVVDDTQWGGYIEGTVTLSPTSRMMVALSDDLICLGGDSIARDEYEVAERLDKHVYFEAAEKHHAIARSRALRKGLPEPHVFRGALHAWLIERQSTG